MDIDSDSMATRDMDLKKRLDSFKGRLKEDEDFEGLFETISSMDSKALRDHLALVLPLSLQLTDNHIMRNKALGVKCLSLVVSNLSHNELKGQGMDGLLFHSLHHLIYHQDEVLTPTLLSTLLLLMKSFRFDPLQLDDDRCDQVVGLILLNLETSSSPDMKLIYWRHLPAFFEFMDIAMVKYIKRLFPLFSDQLSFLITPQTEPLFLAVISSLLSFISVTLPRISSYFEDIFLTMFKFMFSNDPMSPEISFKAKQVFSSLEKANRQLFEKCLQTILNTGDKKCISIYEIIKQSV